MTRQRGHASVLLIGRWKLCNTAWNNYNRLDGCMQSSQGDGEKTMARTIVHRGRKIQVAVDESPGRDGQIVRRDVVLHPGAVAILPLIDADHVCLLRNERPSVGETLWEIPAGTLEPG